MILSDKDIVERLKGKHLRKKQLKIEPCNYLHDVQPASIDLHLASSLKKLDGAEYILKDTEDEDITGMEYYILKPGEFILGSTKEYCYIPTDLVGIVDGKSSIARLGVSVHITAGYIDPGFKGNITLEIKNVSDKEFILKKDMSICQLILCKLSSECSRPYGSANLNSHYQESKGTVLSRWSDVDGC